MMQGFLEPALQFLIEQDPLHWYKNRNWQQESSRFCQSNFIYPAYYKEHNFHGVRGGYLSIEAAVSYDPISRCLILPNEGTVRQSLIARIQGRPRRILDLGCGTGSMTLALKRAFPQAEVIGLDLSPYMLVVATSKAQKLGLTVQFLQGNAESTPFPDRSFDLVTASLLFHETPNAVARAILRESYRLLQDGGEIAILDGNQQVLRRMNWTSPIFEEPYLAEYALGSVDAWLGAVGFESVQTHSSWWVQQVSHGVR